MASESEASCDADPNFAVICSFLERFGAQCGLQAVDFVDLQRMLENTQDAVSPVLIDLHIKLMRKIRKSITVDRWERGIVKVCHMYSNQDAWEIERFGYKKARLSAKIRLLKELLEMQFDNNTSFKNKINAITAKELRSHPIGRDKLGNAYWYQIDESCQIRVYKEDPDEETWALVAKDREGLVTLISKLGDNQDSSSTDAVTNDDSNSNNEETKTLIDTGQQDSNSSKKSSSDDDKPPVLKHEVDDEDTKMDDKDVLDAKMPELVAPTLQEERKPELSGIKEKYIRSDNYVQPNRKAVESAGFVDIGMNLDMKRPMNEIIDEPTLVKRPRTARPTLLGNKKKPYLQEGEDDWDGDEDDDLEEEEELDEEEDDLDDDEENDDDEVGEAIEEPLMLVMGKGSGKDNQCGNPIVGEVVEEEVMYFFGVGSGRECETGNEDKKEEASEKAKESSIKSPTKNSFKLGTIIDTKTDTRNRERSPRKNATSLWDVGKPPDSSTNNTASDEKESLVDTGKVRSLVDKFEGISKEQEEEAPVSKTPKFFFGPSSGFSFKAPAPVKTAATLGFGATFTSVKCNDNPATTTTTLDDNKNVNTVENVESTPIEETIVQETPNISPVKDTVNDKGSNSVKIDEVSVEKDIEAVQTKDTVGKLQNHESTTVDKASINSNTTEDELPVEVLTPEHVNSMVSELLKPETSLENEFEDRKDESSLQNEVTTEAAESNEVKYVVNPEDPTSVEQAKVEDTTVSKVNEVTEKVPEETTPVDVQTHDEGSDETPKDLPPPEEVDNKETEKKETPQETRDETTLKTTNETESVANIEVETTPSDHNTSVENQSVNNIEENCLSVAVDSTSDSQANASGPITSEVISEDVELNQFKDNEKHDHVEPEEEAKPIESEQHVAVSLCDKAHLPENKPEEITLEEKQEPLSSEVTSTETGSVDASDLVEGTPADSESADRKADTKIDQVETPGEKEQSLELMQSCAEISKSEEAIDADKAVEATVSIDVEKTLKETVSIDDDKPAEETVSDVEMPLEEIVSIDDDKPAGETVSIDVDKPAEETVSIYVEKPLEEIVSIDDDKPAEEIVSIDVDKPAEETVSIDVEKPLEEIVSIDDDKPAEETVSIDDDKPAEEAIFIDDDKPLEETVPIDVDKSVEQETNIVTTSVESEANEVTSAENFSELPKEVPVPVEVEQVDDIPAEITDNVSVADASASKNDETLDVVVCADKITVSSLPPDEPIEQRVEEYPKLDLMGTHDTISEGMDVEIPVSTTLSIRELIKEVPENTSRPEEQSQPGIEPVVCDEDSSVSSVEVQPETPPEVEEDLEEEETLLDLSCAKVPPIPPPVVEVEPQIPYLQPELQCEVLDFSKQRSESQFPTDFTENSLMAQGQVMPVLPLEVPKIDPHLHSRYLHETPVSVENVSMVPPAAPYLEAEEQVEELNVAKTFLMDNDSIPASIPDQQDESNEEPVIIQEIGSMPSGGFKKQTMELQEIGKIESQIRPADEEEDIVKIRQATNAPSVFEVQVPMPALPPPGFVERPCQKQNVALLGDDDDHSDDMMYDDGNISEPMDLEDSKDGQIIERNELELKSVQPSESDEESVIPDDNLKAKRAKEREAPLEKVAKLEEKPVEPKKPSLQSFTLDYTGEAPDLSHVHALTRRSLKRGADEEAAKPDEQEDAGGKRRKIRGKRAVDKELRKSIEHAKNKDVSSSDEDKKKDDAPEAKPDKKPRQKRKRLVMGLEIPEEGIEMPTGLRQSRRIAQIKIKEEAERRKLEEIALEEMKNAQKRKNKKDDDKDYKAEKRKHNKSTTEDETTNDAEVVEDKKKKKKKRKHKEFDEKNPWRSSSDSSSEDSHVEEEEEEEEHYYIETVKSDHEFSPESDLENAADPQPLKRARTVRKEDEEQVVVDDYNCQKCTKSDHPEWILLCDGCDAGWHCSCLRPALFVIPEGDWYCPPCQHNSLIKLLQEKLVEFDKVQSKKEVELRRKERLAYVGISLANVLPEKTEDSQKAKKERIRKPRVRVSGDESSSSSESGSSGSESGSSSDSGSSSSDSDEPIYKLRQRRQAHSYQFKEYDELIKSATQEVAEDKQEVEPQVRGKDMATIVQAELKESTEPAPPKEDESEEDEIKPVRKVLGKKKHRRLNSLDISSEEDEDSDEDFQGSSSDEDDDEYDDYNESSSNSSIIGRRKKGRRGSVRRSTRARINRYDREFINDDSEDSDEPPLRKRGRGSDWEDSEESEEESDRSWGRKKKRGGAAKPKPANISSNTSKHKKTKKKRNDDSDPDSYRKKKPKIKFGGLDDDDGGKRRTRGKKINYLDVLGTDSEEEGARRNQVKDEESEDEFVLNEEEEEVPGEEGREDASSDDSNIGGLIPAVKKGSKKGMGKGGIKRIKRSQVEEEEALFPPLPDAAGDMETNPIEQINKNLEAMDEKEIGEMMEDEEYANRQLQMVAAQLEKEKRRKEMEARRLEMAPQPAAVPAVRDVAPSAAASVIQAMPVTVPPQMMPTHLRQLQPIHHDLSHPAMLHQLPPMHHAPAQIPHHSPHSPQHLLHHGVPPHQSPMMLMTADTPKKRGRKPKSQLASPEINPNPVPFIPTPSPSMGDKSDDSEQSFNADGTPRKRRGRGKGKKTLEKEAAAAAALAAAVQSPSMVTTSPPSTKTLPVETKEPVERPPETKPVAVAVAAPVPEIPIPMVGGKLGVASAPQPFSQSQPKPSVITRMLQTQPGQPAYPVGGTTHNFSPDRPLEPRPQGPGHPFLPGGGPAGIPPRGLHLGAFRPGAGANHYPVIRSGAPPIRSHLPPHMYHHPMETPPLVGPPLPERSSPALTSPASASPLSNKSEPTPPPPAYAVRPPMLRYPPPPTTTAPPGGIPLRHPQLLPQMHPARPPFASPPHNYHYPPQYADGGGAGGPYQPVPPQAQYQDPQQFAGDADGAKNYEEEENGEFGGLVSYFSSQREDDLDT